jgi:NADPH2:quinone reductase
VIATTSTDEKATLASRAGADHVIGYGAFAQRAREVTGGVGMAAVYDGVGKATFLDGFDALAPTGRMILYGAASGRPDPLDPSLLQSKGSLYVQRPTLATYARTPELLRDRASAVFELIEIGVLKVRIGATYPLADARQAHGDLVGRKTTGKLLLKP